MQDIHFTCKDKMKLLKAGDPPSTLYGTDVIYKYDIIKNLFYKTDDSINA